MLISPPFLLTRNANESEEDWINRCMDGGLPGDGAYPVSFRLGWHGGMHLSAIDPAIQQGRVVYRKAALATAGQIYGNAQRQIHFEIACDDTNLTRLVGRASGDLQLTANGRTDAVYGEMYFHLPAGAQVFAQRPLPNKAQAMMQPPGQPAPAPQPLQAAHTTADALIVGLRYAGGEGAVGDRGDAYVTTYQLDGTPLGAALQENDAEYNLYASATTISTAYPATDRPAPSAVYELLRFGRVIGPDALKPATVPHWREVRHPGGQGWVNLNAANIRKFSDADFPHWKQWRLIDDAVGQDSRCDSAVIRGWLDVNNDGQVNPAEATAQLSNAAIAPKLARAICKFPSEWDAATIDARWGWLKSSTAENPQPLTSPDFELLRAHITALAFWPGGMGITAHHWHWQPREFIKQFRKCGWLSPNELSQLLPRLHGSRGSLASISWAIAQARFRPYAIDLNKALRKYLIQGYVRQVHFLAQTYIETAMWRVVEEIGQARQQRRSNGTLYWPAPMMQYYTAFYGRGIMQLTWAGNYSVYGTYRAFADIGATHTYADARITQTSTHYLGDPSDGRAPAQWHPKYDPDDIVSSAYNACDSGAHYWISKAIGGGNVNINRVADQGVTTQAVGRASVLVNGGGFGYAERQAYAPFIERYLGDGASTTANSTFVATRGQRNYSIYVDFTAQRP